MLYANSYCYSGLNVDKALVVAVLIVFTHMPVLNPPLMVRYYNQVKCIRRWHVEYPPCSSTEATSF